MDSKSIQLLMMILQIVGTSEGFNRKKKKNKKMMKKALASASDSEESYSSTSHGRAKSNVTQSFSQSTPPPTLVNDRTAKRRSDLQRGRRWR